MLQFFIGDLPLTSGEVLPDVSVAYETFGRLDPDGSNAILVTHGLTSGTDMLLPSSNAGEGSWAEVLNPGRALDAQRYFIICSNVVGSSLGSTGPTSPRPGTDKHWGPDFPKLTLSDMVNAQRSLLGSLGVTTLQCVVGPSFGGMQALQWALDYPDVVNSIGVIVSGLAWPEGLDSSRLHRRLENDAGWNQGWYAVGQDLLPTMTALRYETLIRYGAHDLLEEQWPSEPKSVQNSLHLSALNWARRFDANALLALHYAGERFDVRSRLSEIRCPMLFVPSRTDLIFPPSSDVRQQLTAALPSLSYLELDTPFGHSASGRELCQWEKALKDLLAESRKFSHS